MSVRTGCRSHCLVDATAYLRLLPRDVRQREPAALVECALRAPLHPRLGENERRDDDAGGNVGDPGHERDADDEHECEQTPPPLDGEVDGRPESAQVDRQHEERLEDLGNATQDRGDNQRGRGFPRPPLALLGGEADLVVHARASPTRP